MDVQASTDIWAPYIHYEVWDEITSSFPNFNGTTVEV